MNKKLFFALAATVGLFASCSSDELISENASQLQAAGIDDNAPAAIQIGMGNLTRGTGTVGSNVAADNYWAGQTFNLFMLKKGTMELAKVSGVDAQGAAVETAVFNNSVMKTPDDAGATTIAKFYNEDDEEVTNYYPQDGTFDFWAYRLDDAATGDPTGVDDAAATQITVPFTINGSQDILIGTADPAIDAAGSGIDVDRVYSAYAARRGVNPKLSFSHELTRLTFQVVAATEAVSDQATLPAGATAGSNAYEVTGISVKSKTTGELIAAYSGTAPERRISWTDDTQKWDDPATLVELNLMQRGYEVTTKEQGTFSSAVTSGQTYNFGGITDVNGATINNITISDATTGYDSNATDSRTGKPTGNAVTAAEAAAAGTSFYLYVKTQNMVTGAATSASADLVNLEPVVPEWDTVNDEGLKTNVGEALLVAPADENGYEVTVYFQRWKQVTATTATLVADKVTNTIQRKTTGTGVVGYTDFEAGKSYNIVIKLFADGTTETDTELQPWGDGTGLEDEYEFE